MKINKKIKSILIGAVSLCSPLGVISCSCTNRNTSKDYDLGLVADPINSLNYIKFASVNKILPSLVESPLKTGPEDSLKRMLSLPEIPMGIYNNEVEPLTVEEISRGMSTLDKFFEESTPPENPSSSFYALDQFGMTTGTLSSEKTHYHPVSVVMKNNKIQSTHLILNNGMSKWSNGEVVCADDYIDAIQYILDLSTGSQKLTSTLQRKIANSQNIVDAQQDYIKEFGISYKNPFQYPDVKVVDGKVIYDVFNENYKIFPSQINEIMKSQKFADVPNKEDLKEKLKEKEAKIIERMKIALENLGLYSGRLYWNYSNKEIISSIPYSPDFNPHDDETIIMLPNEEYTSGKYSEEELRDIPQRKAVRIKKYLFNDRRQKYNFEDLLKKSQKLKSLLTYELTDDQIKEENFNDYNIAVNTLYKENVLSNDFINGFNAKFCAKNRILCLDEYSLRVEYSPNEPTSLSNAVTDLQTQLIPINRRFVETNGGINEFGLNASKFLTNGAFIFKNEDLVLGPQGYIVLHKNNNYYSSTKTSCNKIKIFFTSDTNISSTLYDDKYIAATKIPAIQQFQYWTNKNYRKYMKKSQGFGTIALAFNLDKERYEKAKANGEELYLYDENLRNAIYYGINRNAMLNFVGWNSSFPVITWTAFGQGASSYGDAIEVAFDHDYMYTKFDVDKAVPIPIQNYTHLDHMSKSYKFEYLDRTDKGFQLEIAQKYLEQFKKDHPGVDKVKLRFISNSTDEQQNAGIALQDFMRKAFNDFIEIEIKSLPENVYEDFRTKGEFDILYRNFDTFGTDAYSYVKVFFKADGIDTENAKNTGFRNNPSGSWTYEKYFSELGYKTDENGKIINDNLDFAEQARTRLRINKKVWNKILDLSFRKRTYVDSKGETKHESITEYNDRFTAFFTNQFTKEEVDEGWTEQSSFAIIAALEKIVRDGAPVVPLMEVDTYWEISRVNGASNLYTYSLQFAYDTSKPPKPNLPTAINEE